MPRPSGAKRPLALGAVSGAGQVRELNEGCVATPLQMGIPASHLTAKATLLAVADGMGGRGSRANASWCI